jgi:hypothetical protein
LMVGASLFHQAYNRASSTQRRCLLQPSRSPAPSSTRRISVQSDNRARSSSTFAISSLRRGFFASDVSAKSRIKYRASAAASAQVVDGAARAWHSKSSWRRRRAA